MAKQRSEASRWISSYGEIGETLYVADGPYLAEKMVEKIAAKDGVKLPTRFWNHPLYKKDFLAQLNHANKLLKQFSCEVILECLRNWRMKKIYSLGLKSVIEPICQEIAQKKSATTDLQDKHNFEMPEKREDVPIVRPAPGRGGILGKLRD